MCTRPNRRWNATVDVQGDTVEAMADALRAFADEMMAKAQAGEKFPRLTQTGESDRNGRARVRKDATAPQGEAYIQAVQDAYASQQGWQDDAEDDDTDDDEADDAVATPATVDGAAQAAARALPAPVSPFGQARATLGVDTSDDDSGEQA